MRRLIIIGLGLMVAAVLTVPAAISSRDHRDMLEWDVMAAISEPYTGDANPIRGINGGGLPWELDRAKGALRVDGRLTVKVKGLVLARRAPVPPELQGTNPVPMFKALVSCLTTSSAGVAETVNVSTQPVPATSKGNAKIKEKLTLPSPCFAPIVFVTSPPSATSPDGAWFAVTGR